LCLAGICVGAEEKLNLPAAEGLFKPDWNSLTNYHCPEWFRDAKFGIWAADAARSGTEQAQQMASATPVEAEFTAAKGTVETRIKGFTEAGLELPAELLATCWATEAEFRKSQKTVNSIPALKVRAGRATAKPFATLLAGGAASATVPMLG